LSQQFEIKTNHSNKEVNIVILMCLRYAQTHKNNKESFSYFELLWFAQIMNNLLK